MLLTSFSDSSVIILREFGKSENRIILFKKFRIFFSGLLSIIIYYSIDYNLIIK